MSMTDDIAAVTLRLGSVTQATERMIEGLRRRQTLIRHSVKRPRVAFIDLCWSADKSVSVAWSMAPTEAERHLIVDPGSPKEKCRCEE
jgi:hypothetical protein